MAANGIIHGIDNIILLPPPALKIIGFLPGEFSTLQLGLVKTGLEDEIEKSGTLAELSLHLQIWHSRDSVPRLTHSSSVNTDSST